MPLDFTKPEKEKVYELLAEDIKKHVDYLVSECGIKAIKPLEDIKSMPDWLMLKNQESEAILLAMRMYISGVVTTLRREKKDC